MENRELYGLQSRQSDREQEEAPGTEQTRMLHLYPKNVYLGVGCRKNTPEEKIETQIQKYLSEHGIAAEQIILQPASI